MNIIHGYHPSVSSIDTIRRYHSWILSMDIIHGYNPWILSMDIIHRFRSLILSMPHRTTGHGANHPGFHPLPHWGGVDQYQSSIWKKRSLSVLSDFTFYGVFMGLRWRTDPK